MWQLGKWIATCVLLSIVISFGPKLEPCSQVLLDFDLGQIQNPWSVSLLVLGKASGFAKGNDFYQISTQEVTTSLEQIILWDFC